MSRPVPGRGRTRPLRGERTQALGAGLTGLRHGRVGGDMRAVVYERYGGPDVLRMEDVPTPSPAAGQVLVKIAATSINLSDWEGLRGSPLYARRGGLSAPRRRT